MRKCSGRVILSTLFNVIRQTSLRFTNVNNKLKGNLGKKYPTDLNPTDLILKMRSLKTSSSIICWSYLCGHLLRHVNLRLLGCSSHCIRVILVPSICIDNVEVIIIIAMACHCLGSTWSSPSMRDHSSATTWRGALASTSRSAKASSPRTALVLDSLLPVVLVSTGLLVIPLEPWYGAYRCAQYSCIVPGRY